MHNKVRSGTERQFDLASGTHEGWRWAVRLRVNREGFFSNNTAFSLQRNKPLTGEAKRRNRIRLDDRRWVYRNIPSSIHWYNEVHHDWEHGGRMYLLSHSQHILVTRREKT